MLLHGWSIDHRIWDGLRAGLHDRVELLTPDLPGHGGTPVELGDRPLTEYHALAVAAFASWCHDHDVADVPMAGWAWGSHVVVDAVAAGRVAPSSVALISPTGPFQTPALAAAIERDWPRLACRLVGRMTAEPLPEDTANWIVALMTASSLVAVTGVQSTPWRPPPAGFRLPEGSVALAGEQDVLAPPDAALPLLDAWGVTITVLEGAGHLPFLEVPDAFQGWLLDWLARVSA